MHEETGNEIRGHAMTIDEEKRREKRDEEKQQD